MKSSACMRWMGGGFFLPPRHRSTSSDRLRFQRQRDWNNGLVEDRLGERGGDALGGEESGHVVEGEAVVRAERDDHGVVTGRRLELEVEAATELLAQRVAHGRG